MNQEHLLGLIRKSIALCSTFQRRIIDKENAPATSKKLRLFPTGEAADLIGVSESYFRGLTNAGELPSGTVVGGGGRRAFTLEEIHQIREALFEKTSDERYRRRRSGAEKLQIIAVANFKGGVAKTTTAVHLGQYLAMRGYRVLLVDLDSQASLTSIFGYQADNEISAEATLYPVFRGERSNLDGIIRQTYWPGLDLVPACLGLYQSEFELPVRQMRDTTLKFWRILGDTLRASCNGYDIVICDCPPSLGYLSINALCAATAMLVPVPPAMLDFASTGRFLEMTLDVLAEIGKAEPAEAERRRFDWFRIMLSRYKTEDQNQKDVAQVVKGTFRDLVLNRAMAQTTALDAAGNRKRTYYELDAASYPGSRQTYLRGLSHLNALNAEIEDLLLSAWRRPPLRVADPTELAAQ